ncbi:MAG: sporulation initiation factor Spo0A C-terminal domain-containing protein [Eubacteriales bacterium]|nr:sporulation initiation factor Spo0A C-terminal domain-containing protein [Eubacteriales bacterium]
MAAPANGRWQTAQYGLEANGWMVERAFTGKEALERLERGHYPLLLLHACLPGGDGYAALDALWRKPPVCPPRVLLLCEPELGRHARSDCAAPLMTRDEPLERLLRILAQAPEPCLAQALARERGEAVRRALEQLSFGCTKGHAYIAWLLNRLIPVPELETCLTATLYPRCARAFSVSPASVERCVRIAIEAVFTRGDMDAIESWFGSSVDPERGKPTNRFFLTTMAEKLRRELESYSRSPNSSEMHHSPAAPTSV